MGEGNGALDDVDRAVFILEDQPSTLAWLSEMAATAYPDRAIVSATTIAAAKRWLSGLPRAAAPVCLVDIGLPDGSGIDFIRDLLARVPSARAVILTLYEDDSNLLLAMAAGAHGYLLKDREEDVLVERLRGLDRGEVPMSPAMADRVLALFRQHARFVTAGSMEAQRPDLTRRELEVLRMIGRGLTVAETGEALEISRLTVSGHVKAIYRKLDINSRAEAATEAVRRGLA